MNGEEFYQFLLGFYHIENQDIYDDRQFIKWLPNNEATANFQFRFPSRYNRRYNANSIPKRWIVDAKNAKNAGEVINRNWFNIHFNQNNFNNCRATVAIWLVQNH